MLIAILESLDYSDITVGTTHIHYRLKLCPLDGQAAIPQDVFII